MTHHHFAPAEITGKLVLARMLETEGHSTAHICRRLQVSELTYLRWEKKYADLTTSAVGRLRDLEHENATLRATLGRVEDALSELRSTPLEGLRAV